MRLKLDENLPSQLRTDLVESGHEADAVADEGLTGAADADVLAAATAHGRMLLTLDRGFGDLRAHPPGSHHGIVVLRPASQDALSVRQLVERFLAMEDVASLSGCIVVVEPARVRVRRPIDPS